MRLLEPLSIGPATVANRIMFGPHVTNLGDDQRELPERWVRYLATRAEGGCGMVVTEGASVHSSDWPYERAPLAERCAPGWSAVAAACHRHDSLLIAGLDHAGGQGSSAYSQRELWAPSRVPEVNSREVPKWMEPEDIGAVVAGFETAARLATEAGCDGVEINAGQHSLIRQFLSGLTNHRGDEWGQDKALLCRQVIAASRAGAGSAAIIGLRLSCDELAPWAGITPETAAMLAVELAGAGVDYLVVVRGAIFSNEKTRADFHEPAGYNIDVCRTVRAAVRHAHPDVAVYLQGSIVDPAQAEWALDTGVCDGVEMTRAQIADPELVNKLRRGVPAQIRPCVRCNQTCQVRDARNPLVTCIGEPSSGRETEDPQWLTPTAQPRSVTVVGAGVAGLEAARVAATRGHRVRIVERAATPGGIAAAAGPGAPLVAWLLAEVDRLGVTIACGTEFTVNTAGEGETIVQATGGQAGHRPYAVAPEAAVLDIAAVRTGAAAIPTEGCIALFDPIGGPIAVALAEELGARAVLITQDNIAGNELSRSGDLAPANVRLAQAGVQVERRTLLRAVNTDHVVLEDRFSGVERTVPCVALIDCGFRLPTPPIEGAAMQIGDCVAPRTIYEAVLEGRRAARAL